MKRTILRALICALLGSVQLASASAQTFPTQTIKLVVPYPPGVTPDITARVLAAKLGDVLGQAVIVDNRLGAGGTIGAAVVAKAPADGYTMLYAPSALLTMTPLMYKKLPYSNADLQPVSFIGYLGYLLMVNNDFPAANLKEFVDYVRAHPKGVRYASYGIGSGTHLSMELFAKQAGLQMEHIPYKSTPTTDVMSAQVQLMLEPYGGQALEVVKAGKLKALGVTPRQRSPEWPNVPSMSEVAPGYDVLGALGIWLPAKTPTAIRQRYLEALGKVMAMPEVKDRFRSLSIEPVNTGPAPMLKTIEKETALWSSLVKELDISLD